MFQDLKTKEQIKFLTYFFKLCPADLQMQIFLM